MDEDGRYNLASRQLPDALRQLQAENARLKALIAANGIPLEEPALPNKPPDETTSTLTIQRSAEEKISLFINLFRGRTDVYPLRWESLKGISGYSPACGNEWRQGISNIPIT